MKDIENEGDPLWDFWLSVYCQSFPENERMTIEYLASRLAEEKDGEVPSAFFGVSEWRGQPAGIAFYQPRPQNRLVELWYLEVAPTLRGSGAGTALFGEVEQAAKALNADLLVWEVELPNETDPTPARRIAWYGRQGGEKLDGIRYHVSVDRPLPPVPMGLMVRFLNNKAMAAAEVYARLKANYGDSLEQNGVLRFA